MELILWRHAEAEDPGPKGDFARELTKKGRKQAERMAEWLRPRLEGKWRVIASPAARAIQTVTPLGLDDLAQAEQTIHEGARQLAWVTMVDIAAFFAVLLIGFAYVWRRGDLDWVRAVSQERAAAGPRPQSDDPLEQESVLSA